MIPERALTTARDVAADLGAFCLSRWDALPPSEIQSKAPLDFVSTVDRTAEDMARERLARAFPEIPVVGEEGGGNPGRLYWVVDPLDGTTNYLSGLPLWCVSIALMMDGRPVAGAIDAPALNLSLAAAGDRLELRGTRIRPGFGRLVAMGRNNDWAQTDRLEREAALMADGYSVVNLGSCALSLAFVALGRLGGYVEYGTRLWDCAAGAAICEAAGVPCRLGPLADRMRIDVEAGNAGLR